MVKDKLFLLSEKEVSRYLPTDESRRYMYFWWLRSPGLYTKCAKYVDIYGRIFPYDVNSGFYAVRPALHLNLSYLQSLKRDKEGYVMYGNRKWIILDEKTGLLLFKEDTQFDHRFDGKSNNYEHSEIRAYLNGELLNELFTEEEQKLIVDTTIDGEESSPSKLIELDSAKQSDLISRKEVLSIIKNVFDEYRMSYGEQYKGFAADVPKAIKAIPSVCVTETLEDAEAMKEVCEPEYLGENHLIGCRDGRCSCGTIVKSFQNFCDACGIQLEWGNVWGQN